VWVVLFSASIEAVNIMEKTKQWFDVGSSVGRQQAFSAVSTKCSAAQAQCLQQIRESRSYEELGLTWEAFCKEHAGMSRPHADALIRRYAEFGDAFFRVSEITPVSQETFRQIAAKVDGDFIEIDGEALSLTPENAPRIRSAIQKLRQELKHALSPNRQFTTPEITDLLTRVEALLQQISKRIRPIMRAGDHAAMNGVINYTINHLKDLSRDLNNITPEPI
jgi:hypothetical protein